MDTNDVVKYHDNGGAQYPSYLPIYHENSQANGDIRSRSTRCGQKRLRSREKTCRAKQAPERPREETFVRHVSPGRCATGSCRVHGKVRGQTGVVQGQKVASQSVRIDLPLWNRSGCLRSAPSRICVSGMGLVETFIHCEYNNLVQPEHKVPSSLIHKRVS